MPRIAAPLVTLTAIAFGTPALTESPSRERAFVEFFVGNCLLNMPDLERIRATARFLQWTPLGDDAATMLGSQDPTVKAELWGLRKEGDPYVIGVSEGTVDGQQQVGCTLGGKSLNQAQLIRLIKEHIRTREILDEVEARQRYVAWEATVDGELRLLWLITLPGVELAPMSLSVLAPPR